ncbi:MAG: sulfite exporter TauE/SafE family protein [Candidatus Omnitrophica bacterium]|nr:sulfite exporter TauE/SafE family protein [Candidatus Omnitrophota bacterium]
MEWIFINATPILALTFLVALIYSSVGHGGASGYLAILYFLSVPYEEMAMSALWLNILVAGLAFWNYAKAGYFSGRLTWPFLVTSIPAAFVGGLLKVSPQLYSFLLIAVFLYAAFRLWMISGGEEPIMFENSPSLKIAFPLGTGVGILSGIVGVGGGIFLSPIILLFHWAGAKQTAATSALFILLNSAAGLVGRHLRGSFEWHFSPSLTAMVVAAFIGGLLGSRLGAYHFSSRWLRRALAFVLLIAALKKTGCLYRFYF